MKTKIVIGLAALAGLTGTATIATAQDVIAEVRTWTGESWRLSQPSLEIFYTIMPKVPEEEAAPAAKEGSIAQVQMAGPYASVKAAFGKKPEPQQGHWQTYAVTLSRHGVETQIPLSNIRTLQFVRQPAQQGLLPPYVAPTHFRYSAVAELVDGSRVEGDYVNLGTVVLRGLTPQGRVDIPWYEVENVRFKETP
ncbi:MAG TPA: hypothetical protein VFM04_01250 [Candidatus Methylomirabilis sp.]|nr:hypothetical protein [Candidatus Methylomirabilis sp.]